MPHEYWATFSIYDHRTAAYRQSLLLFDRVVVPVAAAPYGTLSATELEQLRAEVQFLSQHGAAVQFNWDPSRFSQWRAGLADEALAANFDRDRLYMTRWQLQVAVSQGVGDFESLPDQASDATAVPVYGPSGQVDDPTAQEVDIFELILKRLPMPAADAPLEDILRLRASEAFQGCIAKLRAWQEELLLELVRAEKDPRQRELILRIHGRRLDAWREAYAEAMSEAKLGKIESGFSLIGAVGKALAPATAGVLSLESALGLPEKLFKLRSLRRPCWKIVNQAECAPAGVVYWSEKLYARN